MSKNLFLSVSCLLGLGACASTSNSVRSSQSDVRGSTAVSAPAPRLLVTGPVRLLHANFDRRAGVTFFKAIQKDGAAGIDCGGGAAVGWDGESDLDVGQGEGICVAAAKQVSLSWHARTGVEAAEVQQAKR
jgi:hypothetical protein